MSSLIRDLVDSRCGRVDEKKCRFSHQTQHVNLSGQFSLFRDDWSTNRHVSVW